MFFRVSHRTGAHGEEVWRNWLPGGCVGDQEVKGQPQAFSANDYFNKMLGGWGGYAPKVPSGLKLGTLWFPYCQTRYTSEPSVMVYHWLPTYSWPVFPLINKKKNNNNSAIRCSSVTKLLLQEAVLCLDQFPFASLCDQSRNAAREWTATPFLLPWLLDDLL